MYRRDFIETTSVVVGSYTLLKFQLKLNLCPLFSYICSCSSKIEYVTIKSPDHGNRCISDPDRAKHNCEINNIIIQLQCKPIVVTLFQQLLPVA